MRRLVALLALGALACAPAAPALGKGPAHPGKRYCKKHAKHLTTGQRRWCRRRAHAAAPSRPAPAPVPAPGPLVQPPAPDPALITPPPADSGASATTAPPATTATLGRLAVVAREYSLALSRTELPAGAALVELQNKGEDPHNLRIEPQSAGASAGQNVPDTPTGQISKLKVTLAPGSYRLFCTLPSHDAWGMHATLTVVP